MILKIFQCILEEKEESSFNTHGFRTEGCLALYVLKLCNLECEIPCRINSGSLGMAHWLKGLDEK